MSRPNGYKGLVAFHIIYPLGVSVLYVRAGKVMLLYGYRIFLLPPPLSRVFIIPYQCFLLGIDRYDRIAFFYVPLYLGIAIVKGGMTVRVLPAIGDTFPIRLQGISQGRYLQCTALMSNGYAFFAESEGKFTDAFLQVHCKADWGSPLVRGSTRLSRRWGKIRMMYGYVFPTSSGFTDPINGNFAGMIQLIQA
jgi:hypothetical protein